MSLSLVQHWMQSLRTLRAAGDLCAPLIPALPASGLSESPALPLG